MATVPGSTPSNEAVPNPIAPEERVLPQPKPMSALPLHCTQKAIYNTLRRTTMPAEMSAELSRFDAIP